MAQSPEKHRNQYRLKIMVNGKRSYAWFQTIEEANAASAQIERQKKESKDNPLSIVRLGNHYLSTYFNNKREGTKKIAEGTIKWLSEVFKTIAEINDDTLYAAVGQLSLRSSTKRLRIKHVKWFIDWCNFLKKTQIIINYDYIRKTFCTKDDAKAKRYIDDDEFGKIIAEEKQPYRKTIWQLMGITGIRVGEMTNLSVNCLQMKKDQPFLVIPAEFRKQKEPIEIPIINQLYDEMKEMCKGKNPDDKIFTGTKTKSFLSAKSISNLFVGHCKKIGIGKRNIHLLRAYAWNYLYEETNHNIELVRKMVGWSSAEYKKYVGNMEQEKIKLVMRMNRTDNWLDQYNFYFAKSDKEIIAKHLNEKERRAIDHIFNKLFKNRVVLTAFTDRNLVEVMNKYLDEH